ncbi:MULTISPECIES: hypothetical protein [Nostocales]|nr:MULTISPECIES: hypothetical protein [Nostocales]MDB9439440.1 hypothetical protein [Dolichospermum lemmermannii CS-548]MDB9449383.1 hypothetical protein [Dolichospermum circinale CS-547]
MVGAKHLEKHFSQLPIIYLPNASPVQLSVVRTSTSADEFFGAFW